MHNRRGPGEQPVVGSLLNDKHLLRRLNRSGLAGPVRAPGRENSPLDNGQATVMRFAGGSWQTVGRADFSSVHAWFISLAIDLTGTPHVAYSVVGR